MWKTYGERKRRVYGTNFIIAGLKYAADWYFSWQGTYTSSFLMIALSPLNGFELWQLRAVMVLNILLFGVALWVFISAFCKSLNVEKMKYVILFFSLAIIGAAIGKTQKYRIQGRHVRLFHAAL